MFICVHLWFRIRVSSPGSSAVSIPKRMTDRIRISALLFGLARETVGSGDIELDLEQPATVATAFSRLAAKHPKLAAMERSLMFAVNEEYAGRETALHDGDCLAVLPPVSGGAAPDQIGDITEITREPIDIPGLRGRLLAGESGAVVIFDGVARNNTKGRRTLYLEYEGYESMALKTMSQIIGEVRGKWDINSIGIVHRLGRIEISESSVVIVVASAHRRVAFEAGQYAIDRLKKIVPIWKKEYFADGEVWNENPEAMRPE
jgi:molybdopterin synthase catalytic subunit